jgi:hypothetical protein
LRKIISAILLAVFLVTPSLGFAEEEVKEETFIYATYFNCDPALEEAADAEVEKYTKPAHEAAIAAGDVTAWGYAQHHTGGNWRRMLYRSAGSMADLLAGADSIDKAYEAAAGDYEGNAFGAACNSHDDYIWSVTDGSGGTGVTARGSVGMSTYLVCDLNGESRADELVAETFGPIYDKYVADGSLSSWGWLSHIVGGKYRRVETMTAKDLPTLMAARGKIIDDFDGSEDASKEFSSICTSHTDYLWNIVHEAP